MENHDFDASILHVTAHRPWPMLPVRWVMTQTWHDLLFAHWPIDPGQLRGRIPAPFELDVFDDRAWLGIVPFRMSNVAVRGTPSLPWVSAFPELNVRTYVRVGDRPGIYFFSLDAGRALAVAAARALLNLPYYTATMRLAPLGKGVQYRSSRSGTVPAVFTGTYAPCGEPFTAVAGSLEHFLTERYCLYHHDHRGSPYRLEIHHPPWPLQPALATITANTMAEANGLTIGNAPLLLHFVRRQDMVAWLPVRLHGETRARAAVSAEAFGR